MPVADRPPPAGADRRPRIATGARICAVGLLGALGRYSCFGDLAAGAVARVGQSGRGQNVDGGAVAVEPLRLEHDFTVPVESERGQVVQLTLCVVRAGGHAVQVLHPHHEGAAGRAREQPGQQGRSQVPEVKVPRGAGRVPSGCHDRHSMADREPAGSAEVIGQPRAPWSASGARRPAFGAGVQGRGLSRRIPVRQPPEPDSRGAWLRFSQLTSAGTAGGTDFPDRCRSRTRSSRCRSRLSSDVSRPASTGSSPSTRPTVSE